MTPKRSAPKSGIRTVQQLLYWLSIGVAIIVAIANVTPYVKAANFALLDIFDIANLAGFPRLISNRVLFYLSIGVGVVLWAFIQTAETYPILLKHDRKLMRIIAEEAESSDSLEIHSDDDPALKTLKHWYNRFPLLSVRASNRASLLAYVIDTFICLSVYPPVDGGFGQLLFVVFTGQWGMIRWSSVALIIVMLFVFELMIKFLLFLGMQAYYLRRAHGQQSTAFH